MIGQSMFFIFSEYVFPESKNEHLKNVISKEN